MNDNWHGLIKLLYIQHVDVDGKILWEEQNKLNLLHVEGQEFILKAVFLGGTDNSYIPENYYLGLDRRAVVSVEDAMSDIESYGHEPNNNGYIRQSVSSSNSFSMSLVDDVNRAITPTISFSAAAGSWGPVDKLFLTDQPDNTGFLIATVTLSSSLTLDAGQSINCRMALSLRDCPAS